MATISEDKLIAALGRKYSTAREALQALGLDAALVEVEGTQMENVLEIKQWIENLTPQDFDQFGEMFDEIRAARTVAGADEPPPFPGRPRPGGAVDPVDGQAADRRRKPAAMDSAAARSFAQRWPSVIRVLR